METINLRFVEVVIFTDLDAALAWRDRNGGWVFVPSDTKDYFPWFCMKITVSQAMFHQATHGLSGEFI